MKIRDIIVENAQPGSSEWWKQEIIDDISDANGNIIPVYARVNVERAAENAASHANSGPVSKSDAINYALSLQGFSTNSTKNGSKHTEFGMKPWDTKKPEAKAKPAPKQDNTNQSAELRKAYKEPGSVMSKVKRELDDISDFIGVKTFKNAMSNARRSNTFSKREVTSKSRVKNK